MIRERLRRDQERGGRGREDRALEARVLDLVLSYRDTPDRIGELLASDVALGRLDAADLETAYAHLVDVGGEALARAAFTPRMFAGAAPVSPVAAPIVAEGGVPGVPDSSAPDHDPAPSQVRPLAPGVVARLEPLLGTAVRLVRVHDDTGSREVADSVGAAAVTVGQDVYLGASAARSGDGALGLLAHEAAHAVQQAGAVGGVTGRAGAGAEAEARAVHAAVLGAPVAERLPITPTGLAVAAFGEAPEGADSERLTALRNAVNEGNQVGAQTAYRRLQASDRTRLAQDRALIVGLLELVSARDARTTLAALRLGRRDALDVAAAAKGTDTEFLTNVLRDNGVRDIATLTAAAVDVVAFEAYQTQAILQPYIEGPRVSTAAKLALATSEHGATILRHAWPDTSPFNIFGVALASDPGAITAFETNEAFRSWCVSKPEILRQVVQGTTAPERWARALWRSSHADAAARWFAIDKAFWGPRLQTAFATPELDDSLTMQSNGLFRGHAFEAIHASGGAAAIVAVSNATGLSLSVRVLTVLDSTIEDAALLNALLADPALTADQLFELTANDRAIAGLVRRVEGRRPEVVLQRLAAVPARFVEAYATHAGFRRWVNDTPANLRATLRAVPPESAWVSAFRRYNQPGLLLEFAADRALAAAMRPGLVTPPDGYIWLIGTQPRPITIDVHARGLINLVRDGSGISHEHLRQTFQALYSAPLARAGQNYTDRYSYFGGSVTETYLAVDPDQAAMGYFFEQFGRIPRTHINLASGITMVAFYTRFKSPWIGSDSWLDKDGNEVPAASRFIRMPTSYYMGDNHILMQGLAASGGATSAAPQTGVSGTAFGTARSVDTQTNRDRPGATSAMNLFQNHATHEVGHAVGNRPLRRDGFDISGDEWTRQYADWQTGGNATDYKRMLGWTAALDSTRFTLTYSGSTLTMDGDDIAEFMTKIAERGTSSVSSHRLVRTFGSVDNAILAIGTAPAAAATALYRTVSTYYNGMPSDTYHISGIGTSTRVTYFCTRWGNRYVNFKGEAWTSKVSHYAVSSYREMFAELYTAYYNGQPLPPAIGSKNPQDFFRALDRANPADFGNVGGGGSQAGVGDGGAGAGGAAGAPSAGAEAGRPGPSPNRRPFP